ncbi:cytosolic sulfotransferase 12-like [Andrographis paniculata]|uniref:cytosolic sulfotransferase 12-like n=1 Tax=Andrographis paniculata TaxID=175694 RepID=UPI0021E7D30C|nr:cytosolic sulfotransferase 12-like [Andrographis paniculata]
MICRVLDSVGVYPVYNVKILLMAHDSEKSLLSNDVELLPKTRFWESLEIVRWEGFWFPSHVVKPAMKFRSTFAAGDGDVLLTSAMKTGTTWLKSLALSCTQRGGDGDGDGLAGNHPHVLVPTVEAVDYYNEALEFDIYDAPAPRLLHTHLPYSLLPDSVKTSSSSMKIVYLARNPKDTLISTWHFYNSILRPIPIDKAVDSFCSGFCNYGSFFDHVAEYWIESRKRPEKILFLKYEELKSNPKAEVSKMAEFMGKTLGSEDEVEKIMWRCSLERLRNLEVNKKESAIKNVPNGSFFRKGEVGNWKDYLTPEMAERIDQITRHKLEGIGLFL